MASKPVYDRQHRTTNNIWTTGQIIEANLLNNMQNQIAQNTQGFSNIVSYSDTQPSGDYSQYNQIWLKKANSSTDSIKLAEVKDLDKVVIISQEQPTDNLNKLWIKDDDNVVQVPSFNEFSQSIKDNIAPLYLNTATYSVGQYVTYENKLYMCQTVVTTPGEWSVNSNHFIQASIAGPLEDEGSAKGGWPNINANILNKLNEIDDLKSTVKAIEDESNSKILFVWEHGGIDNTNGELNNYGSTSRSRDITFYDGSKLVSVTNGSNSKLWIIFYNYINNAYTFDSSISIDAGASYTFDTDKYVRFDLRDGLSATELVTGYYQSEIVQDIRSIKDNSPTDESAKALLVAESSETEFLKITFNKIINEINKSNIDIETLNNILETVPTDESAEALLAAEDFETKFLTIIFNKIISEIDKANTNIGTLNDILEIAPTDSMAENILQNISDENKLLSVLRSVINEYIAQQEAKENIRNSEINTDIEALNDILEAAPADSVAENILQGISNENELLGILKTVIDEYVAQQEAKEDTTKIPEYFEENVETAITNYRKNAEEIGHDGDSFIFITDVHWGVNTKNSPALIRYLIENTNLRNVFCGGDILDSGSKASELAKGYEFMQKFNFVPGGLKTVIGNHDYNKNGHVNDSSYWFTLPQTYALFCPKAAMEMYDMQCIEPSTGYYEISYYVDVPATNTRYLFVSIPFGSVYQVTKDWVLAQLTNNPTKNFVMFSHFLMKNAQGEMAGGANGLMYAIKDFTNLKAWIFGHTHIDQVYYMSTGIPMVSVDTDSSRLTGENPYTYTPGTITEQAFDIITVNYVNNNVECARVGRGKNRRVNGGVNTVNISGTLTLTSSITPTGWESSNTAVATVTNGTVTGISSGRVTIKASNVNKEEYWCINVN